MNNYSLNNLVFVLGLLIGSVSTATSPSITLGPNKTVVGVETSAGQAFLGLRYAQSPMGDLRFRPTATPEPSWSGNYGATTLGAVCPQMAMSLTSTTPSYAGSEDCLFINVYRPKTFSGKLPVMVFIHGGGYMGGSGGMVGDGTNLASFGNVVLVTFNYRLGRLGYLSHPVLTKRLGFASGNFGFYDQIAALKWVQSHIAAFGGDPAQVTLFGISAGGGAVLQLISSPAASGLFQRAIIESTFAEIKTQSDAETLGKSYASAAGCSGTDSQVLNCLLNLDPSRLVASQSASGLIYKNEYRIRSENGPVIDGVLFKSGPLTAIQSGQVNGSAFIVGSNTGDGVVGMAAYNSGAEADYAPQQLANSVTTAFGWTNGQKVLQLFGGLHYPNVADGAMALRTNFDMACSMRQVTRALRSRSGKSVRRYVFDGMFFGGLQYVISMAASLGLVPMPLDIGAFSVPLPAFHAINGLYEFQQVQAIYSLLSSQAGFTLSPTQTDLSLQSMMGAYWTQFAKTASPNNPSQPSWPEYDLSSDNAQRLATPASTQFGPNKSACDLYDSLYPNDER